MYCAFCGKELPGNSKFCPACGSAVESIDVFQNASSESEFQSDNITEQYPQEITEQSESCFREQHGCQRDVPSESHRQGAVRRSHQPDLRSILLEERSCGNRRFLRQPTQGIQSVTQQSPCWFTTLQGFPFF